MFDKCSSDRVKTAFSEKINFEGPNGCWLWLGCLNRDGYGLFNGQRFSRLAHRLSYAWTHGEFSFEMTVDHLCKVRNCVNPSHFEIVTRAENALRSGCPPAMLARIDKCKRGHPLAGDNLVKAQLKQHRRECRICRNEMLKRLRKRRFENWESKHGPNAAKTHCAKGHELSGDNLIVTWLKHGERKCKTCSYASSKKQYLKQLAAKGKEPTHIGQTASQHNAAKTHCKRGHELIEVNLDSGRFAKGQRICRICKQQAAKELAEKNRKPKVERTHCKRGHELTEGNLVKYGASKGYKVCLTCTQANKKRFRDKEREKSLSLKKGGITVTDQKIASSANVNQ